MPQNARDLEASAEGLVEEHSGLELRDKGEPGENCNGREEKQTHYDFKTAGHCLHEAPDACFLYQGL